MPASLCSSWNIPTRVKTSLVLLLLLLSACAGIPGSGENGTGEASQAIQTEEIIIALLLVAAVVSFATQRFRIPYTVGLVLVGFGLTLFGQIPALGITPELILALLVPPLVFEAAFHLNLSDLRRNLPVILSLAVPGVILTTLLVGGLVSLAGGFSLATGLVFGALIAATDPVAVVALFRSMGVPKRLQVLLEGESLLNDGTAIVLYNLMLAFALTGQFNLPSSVLQFIVIAGGGLLVGAVAGIIVSKVIGQIDNYLVETTLTTVLAYGSYLIAEYVLGVSGVLAVVAAGLASGQIGPRGMSPTTRIVVFNFWEYAAFLANSFVFLIIGLQIDLPLLLQNAGAIGWGILAVMAARAVTVYGFSRVGRNIPMAWQHVLFWGGLRGAISLALALSLPSAMPDRLQLQAMAFGVAIFTLLVEGLSMKPLIRRWGLVSVNVIAREYEKNHARAIATRAAQTRLKALHRSGLISDYTWRVIRPALDARYQALAKKVHDILSSEPELHQDELSDAWREALRAERSTLSALFRDNIIPEEIYEELVAEVDVLLENPENTWPPPETTEPDNIDEAEPEVNE